MSDLSYASGLSSSFASANRGPLTTIFTPPASCLSETTLVSFLTTPSSSTSGFTTTKIFINHYSWGDASCYPSTIATLSSSTRWDNGYYYSPGFCPSGWASACQQQTDALAFSTTIQSDTTAVLCCPLSWSCIEGTTVNGHGCSTALFEGQTLTSVWPAPNPTPNVVMSLPVQRNLTSWEVPSNTSALCDAIPILWQNTDIQILSLLGSPITSSASSSSTSTTIQLTNFFPTATSTTLASNTATATPLAYDTATTTPTVTPTALSAGAKAAIGISIPITFIGLVLGIFLYFRRRKRHQQPIHHELDTSPGALQKPGHGHNHNKNKFSDILVEADPDNGVLELPSGNPIVYELPETTRPIPKNAEFDNLSSTPDPLLPSVANSPRNGGFYSSNESAPPSYYQ